MEEEKDVKLNEDTTAFTDLMSRSERKEWERVKQEEINGQLDSSKDNKTEAIDEIKESKKDRKKRLKEDNKRKHEGIDSNEKKIIDEIIKNEEPLKLIDNKDEMIEVDAKTNELKVGEISQTQSIPVIAEKMKEPIFDDVDINDNDSEFNPIPLLGIGLILSLIYFIYLVFVSDYNINTFLIINGSILLVTILFFCITTLVSKKNVKIFAIINLVLIICFISFNVLSIFNWNWFDKTEPKKTISKNSNDNKKDDDEKVIETSYLCSNKENSIEVTIKEKNGYITYIKRIELYENNSIAEEMKSYFENKPGFTATLSDETLLTEYNFDMFDINQYKIMIKSFNDAFTLETDFSYISNDKIVYTKYKEVELEGFTCIKKEVN